VGRRSAPLQLSRQAVIEVLSSYFAVMQLFCHLAVILPVSSYFAFQQLFCLIILPLAEQDWSKQSNDMFGTRVLLS